MPRTIQQQSAIDALLNTKNNLALVARAGCGKTTTILEMVADFVKKSPSAEISIVAYSKAIQEEIQEKLNKVGYNWRMVSASTAHSLGYSLLKFRFKSTIVKDKVKQIIAANQDKSPICMEYGAMIEKLIDKAKQAGIGFFCPVDSMQAWLDLADHYGLDDIDNPEDFDKIAKVAQWVYNKSLNDTKTIDYNDMILLPLIYNVTVKFTKDVVIVDEAQDLSLAKQALVYRFIKPVTGRMVVVGDEFQSIFGFTGADSQSLPRMISDLKATILPLNTTFRCAKSIVRLAQTLVPDIQYHEDSPEGEILYQDELPNDIGKIGESEAILCRNTAPLIPIAFQLLRNGIGCKVEGRDIGGSIKCLATRWKIKTIQSLLVKLETYEDREVKKALDKNQEEKAEQIKDRVETLRHIIAAVTADGKFQVSDVVAFIDNLFADGAKGVVTLATYHRSKGREWYRVTLIEHTKRCPSKWAKKDHELEQERNLAYVAWTRAKRVLVFYR